MRVALYLGFTVLSLLVKYVSVHCERQRKLPEGLTLLTCTREVSGSKLGHNTVCPEILRVFSQFI
jgi:hypothetical protein